MLAAPQLMTVIKLILTLVQQGSLLGTPKHLFVSLQAHRTILFGEGMRFRGGGRVATPSPM